MRLSALAPAALKYRRLTERSPWVCSYHRRIRSVVALDSAYTLSGWIGAASVTGTTAGVPYTEHEDENTIWSMPTAESASANLAVPATLLIQYRCGLDIDSPTFLYAAKWTTCSTPRRSHRSTTRSLSAMSPSISSASMTASRWPNSIVSRTTTARPSLVRRRTVCEPMYPAPPV